MRRIPWKLWRFFGLLPRLVTSFAVAFLPRYDRAPKSILHLDGERVRHSVICFELHGDAVHLRAQREITARR